MTQTAPGFSNQATGRTVLRVLGIVLFAAGLLLTIVAFMDFVDTMRSESMEMPDRFFLAFIGLPLMGVGGWCLHAGFMGVAAKYTAGELASTAKDTLEYVGLTEGDVACSGCGARNDATAKFCDDCGNPLGRTCPQCSKVNAGDARFCADCGTALA